MYLSGMLRGLYFEGGGVGLLHVEYVNIFSCICLFGQMSSRVCLFGKCAVEQVGDEQAEHVGFSLE